MRMAGVLAMSGAGYFVLGALAGAIVTLGVLSIISTRRW